jgi:hypothetical protein
MKVLTVLWLLLAGHSLFAEFSYPDFLVSMTRRGNDMNKHENYFINKQRSNDFSGMQNLELFRNCYAKNVLLASQPNDTYRIPKIVHQIWLGSPVPVKYYAWMSSWMNAIGWEYMLWTDEDLKSILLYNQEFYDESVNYGEKADILRLELLLHYGGIYADVDFECVNLSVFDQLNRSFDFYVGFEPIDHGTMNGTYKMCNALIAASPYHPIIKNLVVNMKENWMNHRHETAVQKTGPDYLSRTILDYEKEVLFCPERKSNNSEYRNMYLPCTFLYPFSEPEIRGAHSREELLLKISPETAAIHYWNGSWFITGGRDKTF